MKKLFWIVSMLAGIRSQAQLIGIGTTNPTRAKLEVHGASGIGNTSAMFGGESTGISFQKDWPTIGFNQYRDEPGPVGRYIAAGFAALQYLDPNTGVMSFDMLGSGPRNFQTFLPKRVLSITQAGQMVIGASSHNATLSVSRNPGVTSTAYLVGTTHASAFNFGVPEHTYIRAGKDGGTVFINDVPGGKVVLSGSIGINTATPGFPLEIRQADFKGMVIVNESTFNYWGFRVYPNQGDFELAFNGNKKGQFNGSNGNYVAISDARLKTGIKPLTGITSGLMKLRPVRYAMKGRESQPGKSLGFIAQEVREVFPELITVLAGTHNNTNSNDPLLALNYSGLGPLAIKVIQEQQALIDQQQERIEGLRKRMLELRKHLD